MDAHHPVEGARAPNGAPSEVKVYDIEFTASGSEYFRIWIVNMLLILLTLGLYLPWAKVRKLKYFYSNTWLDGHALDFHGEPRKMLRGTLLVGVFLAVYSQAGHVSPWAALVAAIAFVAVWPLLFRASMRFRLSNTSWRGMRFRFTGDAAGAYAAMLPPLAMFLIPFSIIGVAADGMTEKAAGDFVGRFAALTLLAFLAAFPYFFWQIKRYQHGNYAYGQMKAELRATVGGFYGVFLKTLGVALLPVAAAGAVIGLMVAAGMGKGFLIILIIPLMLAVMLYGNIVPKAFAVSRLQNLVWGRTGNRYFKFSSDLPFSPYAKLQLKNFLLIGISGGFYWPFAVVANRAAQVEAVALRTKIELDALAGAAQRGESDAAGDAAADLFGLDVGM